MKTDKQTELDEPAWLDRLKKYRYVTYLAAVATAMGAILSFTETTQKFVELTRRGIHAVFPARVPEKETASFWIHLDDDRPDYKVLDSSGAAISKMKDAKRGDQILVRADHLPAAHFYDAVDDPLPLSTTDAAGVIVKRVRPPLDPILASKQAGLGPGAYLILDAQVVEERRRNGYKQHEGQCAKVDYVNANLEEVDASEAAIVHNMWVRVERTDNNATWETDIGYEDRLADCRKIRAR